MVCIAGLMGNREARPHVRWQRRQGGWHDARQDAGALTATDHQHIQRTFRRITIGRASLRGDRAAHRVAGMDRLGASRQVGRPDPAGYPIDPTRKGLIDPAKDAVGLVD